MRDYLYDLQCEYRTNPTLLNISNPRFSWKIKAEGRDLLQTEWTLTVKEADTAKTVWEKSEKSSCSFHIEYQGEALKENKRYLWNVRSVLNNGKTLEGMEAAFFETGFWTGECFQGIWIGKEDREDLGNCPLFRKSFQLDKPCDRARLFISARGLYELSVNGRVYDEYLLTPGWTNYNHHQPYLVYDVTQQLRTGGNVIGVRLGDGWYTGEISFHHQTHTYGSAISFAAVLIMESDGECRRLTTDTTWKTADSGIMAASIYDGEFYDLTKENLLWNSWEYDDSNWQRAVGMPDTKAEMTAMRNEGTKRIETLTPKEVLHAPNGDTLIDMGQNMTGWVRISVHAEEGDVIHIKHGEVLDREGNFYSGNLRLAKQEEKYILREGNNVLEPHFTFHGFRYLKILSFPGEVKLADFEGIVLHTDMRPTIEFESAVPLVNQLHHNLLWGQKGNFLDVPTDCPQRDERLGWTGDAQIFCRTACYNFAADGFFTKWLEDVKADQYKNGAVPFVVPDVLPRDWSFQVEAGIGSDHTSAAWGDAITICPWTMYLQYGDVRILEQSYDSMKRYIEYIYQGCTYGSGNPYLWDWGPQLGDWLALDNEEGSYRGATNETYIATSYYAYSVKILYKTAAVLGKNDDHEYYRHLYQKIVEQFHETYLKNGQIQIATQTAQIVPVHFGLLNEDETETAVKKLVQLLEEKQNHLTTGFVGTPYLCHVLSDHGFYHLAYTLLLQEDFPSWLYQVTKGATTIWEHWDGQKVDGSFWSDEMNSFNHYAYGSIGEWLYRQAAGIHTDEKAPGFAHVIIKPHTDRRLGHISCTYDSVSGTVKSAWDYREDEVRYRIEIPANVRATVLLENGEEYKIGSGKYEYTIKI